MVTLRSASTGHYRRATKPTQRRSWNALMVLAMAGCFWLGTGAVGSARDEGEKIANEIRARRFVVVDGKGEPRVEIGRLGERETGIVVWDNKRANAVAVAVSDVGMPHVTFQNGNGQSPLELAMIKGKLPVFVMRDAEGKRRLSMVGAEDGQIGVRLYDGRENNRCEISLGPNGQPRVVLRDNQGTARTRLLLDDAGRAALDFVSTQDHPRIVFQVDANGEATAAIFSKDDKPLWSTDDP